MHLAATSASDRRIHPSHPPLPAGYRWRVFDSPKGFCWGVYVAVLPGRTLYVGQSSNVATRIAAHRKSPWFKFMSSEIGEPTFYWAPVEKMFLISEEQKVIASLAPELNFSREREKEKEREALRVQRARAKAEWKSALAICQWWDDIDNDPVVGREQPSAPRVPVRRRKNKSGKKARSPKKRMTLGMKMLAWREEDNRDEQPAAEQTA